MSCVRRIEFIFLFSLTVNWAVVSQTPPDSIDVYLDDVVVTATRNAVKKSDVVVPIEIITREHIEQIGVSRLNEILQEMTGLITVPSFGGVEGVQLQGMEADYTLILIDGQPVFGRRSGVIDLSRFMIQNIERIEIIKGASSALYGSEALAGVINIITKKPDNKPGISGNAAYRIASFGTHDLSAGVSGTHGKHDASVFVNYFKSDGFNLSESEVFNTVEPFGNITTQLRYGYRHSDKSRVRIDYRLFEQRQQYKLLNSAVEKIFEGTSTLSDQNIALIAEHTFSNRSFLVFDAYATHSWAEELLPEFGDPMFERNVYNQWFLRPEVRYVLRVKNALVTNGAGLTSEVLNRSLFGEPAYLRSEYIFQQLEWYTGRFSLVAGYRYDHHHQFRSQFSPKLGINYRFSDRFTVKSSMGYGYKAPDLRQLYFDFTLPAVGYSVFGYNVVERRLKELQQAGQILAIRHSDFGDPLRPESSENSNLSFHYTHKAFSTDINFFGNLIRDLIDVRAVATKVNGQNVFTYLNVDRVYTAGLEWNGSYIISPEWRVQAGYQLLYTGDLEVIGQLREGKFFARNPESLQTIRLSTGDYHGLFNRSRHMANAKIQYTPADHTQLFIRIFYRSPFGLFDTNQNEILDRYDTFSKPVWLVNLSVNHSLTKNIQLQYGALNLFNYIDPVFLTNQPGRQLFTKLQFQL
ncbi:TonB-dependent receptor plug domain-containing protein [Thermaurantimonas aggregans]|uniref:TonB-dependent receptor plug domain-containing protein n=1 Tax=Thermaurantimonas aggregans TaxID=2173829 RepID=UPI0023F3C750|nr:TonB-dependent receptor [Thermaurantimonas aggregans]MCX8148284.1 TonB-dependent receptor [Thermaurantimonas aggregans]